MIFFKIIIFVRKPFCCQNFQVEGKIHPFPQTPPFEVLPALPPSSLPSQSPFPPVEFPKTAGEAIDPSPQRNTFSYCYRNIGGFSWTFRRWKKYRDLGLVVCCFCCGYGRSSLCCVCVFLVFLLFLFWCFFK